MLGYFLAPYLLEKNLVEIMQQDFDAELRVEKIEINPFVLSLRVNGLELDNPEGEPTARIGEIYTNFQLSSIFRLALTFDEIRFSSPELFVARDDSGNMDFSYLMNSSEGSGVDEIADNEEDSSLLQALVFKFAIEDFVINWSDRLQPDPVNTRLGPITIDIRELNTLPNRPGQQSVVISSESSGTLSWTGDLQLNPLRSSGHATLRESHFPIISAYIRRQSGLEIMEGSADAELDYEVFTTDSGQIKASIVNIGLTFEDIVINSFADGTGFDFAGEDQQILSLPRIQLTDGQFHWPEQTVALGSVSIDNPQISISRDQSGVFNVEPREMQSAAEAVGEAVMESSAVGNDQGSATDQWQLSIGDLAINGLALDFLDQGITPEAQLGITDFNLNISDISNSPGMRFPTSLSLQAFNGGKLSLKGEVSVLPEPLFDFDVNIDAIQLSGLQPYLRQQANLNMESGAVNLTGHISSSTGEPLLFGGDLEVVDLVIAESINDEQLASWKRFAADKIALSVAKRQLDVSRIQFDQLYGDILINKDGSLNVRKIQKSGPDVAESELPQSDAGAETTDQDTGPALNVRIGGIALADASADFADLSLPLPFAVKVDSLNGKMTTISTQSSEPSEVAFEGKVDKYGFARVSGTVTPLQPAHNTDLLVSFENIDVPKFTPYSIPLAGRKVTSGTLDLKLGYAVKDNQLVGENSIVLSDFELGEKVPHPDATDLPLGLAIALLKDVNGKIDIDLPVRGKVDDPDFSYGGVIWGALGNLLLKIVVSPFTALGSMLGIEASELEHIKFLDGRSDLTPPEMQKAGKLAEALALRPELQLSIAGVSDSSADGLALRTALLDQVLQLRIDELAANGDAELQYADQRRMALEQLYNEQLTAEVATRKLEALRMQFTTLIEVEGQADPQPSLDSLAYANAMRDQLIDLQPVAESDLTALASARSGSLKTALLAIDETLQDRVVIAENLSVTRADGESIEMKVTLGGKSD
jgi:hypothetical protein